MLLKRAENEENKENEEEALKLFTHEE